jgi:ATP-dependent Clp protease ATP-binding subunit ClpC
MLFGELLPGEIVVVGVEGEGDDALFTFKGAPKTDIDSLEPVDLGKAE